MCVFLFGILHIGIIPFERSKFNIMRKAIYTKRYKDLISRLKAARIESGMNQVQVAKALGTTQSHISKVEAGQRRLDVIQLEEFAKLYKKPLIYFVPDSRRS